jgi:hypothetical protein
VKEPPDYLSFYFYLKTIRFNFFSKGNSLDRWTRESSDHFATLSTDNEIKKQIFERFLFSHCAILPTCATINETCSHQHGRNNHLKTVHCSIDLEKIILPKGSLYVESCLILISLKK